MNRFRSLAIAGIVTAAAGCSSYQNSAVGITKSESLVSDCSKVGEVSIRKSASNGQINSELAEQARKKGANYVLVASDDALTGTAYRCKTPTIGAR